MSATTRLDREPWHHTKYPKNNEEILQEATSEDRSHYLVAIDLQNYLVNYYAARDAF